jgi:hypothetical protein
VGIEDCAAYPLFTADLLDIMRRHIPRDRWERVARSVIFAARKPGPREGPDAPAAP